MTFYWLIYTLFCVLNMVVRWTCVNIFISVRFGNIVIWSILSTLKIRHG